jgi:antitoxin ParD1/3/4
MPASVALGSHFEEFVKQQLDSGRFNNVSEVVRAGLRLLEDEEKLREIRHRELRAAIQEGIDSEDAGSIEDVVARNRARRGKRNASNK